VAIELNLNELSADSLGDLPWIVKGIVIGVVCVAIVVGGFIFLNKPQIAELEKQRQALNELKDEFETTQRQAANLDAYKKQMEEMKRTFGQLLKQLPSKTEVPALLEDISNAGIASGLHFNTFRPQPEQIFSFYAELPIEISVVGDYQQLATFVSKISALDRIVTLQDFTITKGAQEEKTNNVPSIRHDSLAAIREIEGGNNAAVDANKANNDPNLLTMRMIVKTYRYQEESSDMDSMDSKSIGKNGKGGKAGKAGKAGKGKKAPLAKKKSKAE
jgi:type IV pilus assembly protein PilO